MNHAIKDKTLRIRNEQGIIIACILEIQREWRLFWDVEIFSEPGFRKLCASDILKELRKGADIARCPCIKQSDQLDDLQTFIKRPNPLQRTAQEEG